MRRPRDRSLSLMGLQLAILVFGLVPVGGGLIAIFAGLPNPGVDPVAFGQYQSHYRYLSGLLLGIGLAFWACIPAIAQRGPVIRLLTAIVVLGGLARLAAHIGFGVPLDPISLFALVMELAVTPVICAWHWALERFPIQPDRVGPESRSQTVKNRASFRPD